MDADRDPSPQPAADSKAPARDSLVSDQSPVPDIGPTAERNADSASQSTSSDAGHHTGVGEPQAGPVPLIPAKHSPQEQPVPPLQYRRTPFWLAVLYMVTLIVPWVLICLLDRQPLAAPSYYDQKRGVSERGYTVFNGILAFVSVVRAISGVIVVPITSTILAHATVAYSQRRYYSQKLSMRQLFALADRGWADITILWGSGGLGSSSRLLWLGALLIVMGGVQQPLQSALVSFQPIVGVSSGDLPNEILSNAYTVGYDAEPWSMTLVDHTLVVEDVTNNLVTVSDIVSQEHLWVDELHTKAWLKPSYRYPQHQTRLDWYAPGADGENSTFFVASLANGTQTGVLREHALRLSSSINCENIPRATYPSSCLGERPLVTEIDKPGVALRVCAPDKVGRSPWSMSRNREQVDEELYLDLFLGEEVSLVNAVNFTIHCTSNTSRGYFELGNVMNGGEYGPLIDEWPDPDTIENEFSDYINSTHRLEELDHGHDVSNLPESDIMVDPFGVGKVRVSGPLMISANALFGNNSMLQLVSDNSSGMAAGETLAVLCEHGGIPFTQVKSVEMFPTPYMAHCNDIASQLGSPDYDKNAGEALDETFASWFGFFEEAENAEYLLMITTFLANRAVLNKAVAGAGTEFARDIYYSPGTPFGKPTMTMTSMIIISVLIFLQAVGLGAMVWYISRVPTWTPRLDAMALATIGKVMGDDELPPVGPVRLSDREKLRKVDALVGIVEDSTRSRSSSPGRVEEASGPPRPDRPLMGSDYSEAKGARGLRFGLGAKGLITRDLVSKRHSWHQSRRRRIGQDVAHGGV